MRKRDINIGSGTHRRNGSGVFHIVFRGSMGGLIFKGDDDKIKFLKLLKRLLDKDNSVIYAFVLMDNHAHLLLKTYLLSPLMRNFASSYSRWFNRQYNRKGQLFEKPFTSFPKNNEAWKVDCLLYILLNPVEAGICKHPSQYIFSSYNFYSSRSSKLKTSIEVSSDIITRNFKSYQEFRKTLYSKLEYQLKMKQIKYRKI